MAKLQKKVYICVKVVFCVKIIWWNWLDYMEEKTGRALKWFYMIGNCVVPFLGKSWRDCYVSGSYI